MTSKARMIKEGDPIVVIGYDALIASMIALEDAEDLQTVLHTNGWGIIPGDCHFVKSKKIKNAWESPPKSIQKVIDQKSYHWMICLEAVPPRKAKRKRKRN